MQAISEVFAPGDRLVYVSYLDERPFGYHWTIYEGPEDDANISEPHYHLVFLNEVDLQAIGLGGPKIQTRADLICTADYYPSHYRVITRESVNVIDFNGHASITLPDGSTKSLNLERFCCILGESLGQLALLLKLAQHEITDSFTAPFFSIGAAAVSTYSISRCPDDERGGGQGGSYKSSFLEELLISEDGWLEKHIVPNEGVVSIREDFPLPAWLNSLLPEVPLRYMPPATTNFTLQDVLVPGPVVPIGTTFTIPKGDGPHPIAFFISGSGSHDRHGISGNVDLGSHEIVDYLSEHGWLGVRFDTRGMGNTSIGDDLLEMGFAEVVADARGVLHQTLQRPDADVNCVVLIGHSQGGLTAMELSIAEPTIHGIVLLATAGRPVNEVLRDQIMVRGHWMHQTEAQIQAQLEELDEFIELVRSGREWKTGYVPDRFLVSKRLRKWYADHLERDPRDYISQVTCPILICQGAKDFQVSAEEDTRQLFHAARAAGVAVELTFFQDLDHLFKPVDGESHVSQYYGSERRVSAELKRRVLSFLDSLRCQH